MLFYSLLSFLWAVRIFSNEQLRSLVMGEGG